MIHYFLIIALTLLAISVLGCVYRLLKGPSVPDRISALDTMGILLLSMIAVLCALLRTTMYLDIVLVMGVLTFIGTTAFARYIERGQVFDDRDNQSDR
ncbi:Na(+)/H(+) antiporter subunit F1 [Paenibacillus sanguinis]|uniref:Na(+)/H(+) antiporter subunit F1 n=1 Tax=Paenibacillus sanguinis TaxID=225906 RepID=UPI0003614D3C|nr:Na(+)/H(+) antiporter subunit F1 [Paenibacillus sanguinis]